MNSLTKNYTIAWAVMLAVFNGIAFATPGWAGAPKYTGAFWAGYVFVTIAFVANLCLTFWAFKDAGNSTKRMFYNLPVIRISYSMLIVSLIVGALTMVNSLLPTGIAVAILLILVVFYTVTIVSSKVAIDAVEAVDTKIEAKTSFMKDLRAKADSLVKSASTPAIKEECNKVFEAIRFSDPMSSPSLDQIESQINIKYMEFSTAAKSGEEDKVKVLNKELQDLIAERNAECKAGK